MAANSLFATIQKSVELFVTLEKRQNKWPRH